MSLLIMIYCVYIQNLIIDTTLLYKVKSNPIVVMTHNNGLSV